MLKAILLNHDEELVYKEIPVASIVLMKDGSEKREQFGKVSLIDPTKSSYEVDLKGKNPKEIKERIKPCQSDTENRLINNIYNSSLSKFL